MESIKCPLILKHTPLFDIMPFYSRYFDDWKRTLTSLCSALRRLFFEFETEFENWHKISKFYNDEAQIQSLIDKYLWENDENWKVGNKYTQQYLLNGEIKNHRKFIEEISKSKLIFPVVTTLSLRNWCNHSMQVFQASKTMLSWWFANKISYFLHFGGYWMNISLILSPLVRTLPNVTEVVYLESFKIVDTLHIIIEACHNVKKLDLK